MKYLTVLLVVLGVSTYSAPTVSLVHAAGFNDPSETGRIQTNLVENSRPNVACETEAAENATANDILPNAFNQGEPCSLTLEWQHWTAPYSENGNSCRELNGNLVCVTPESATRLRW